MIEFLVRFISLVLMDDDSQWLTNS